jgi:hypothetical protein
MPKLIGEIVFIGDYTEKLYVAQRKIGAISLAESMFSKNNNENSSF